MYLSKKLLKFNDLKHCFLNRKGGISKGIYESLNCGLGSLDKKINVKKNLSKACQKLKSPYKKLVLLNQVHSNKFFFINNLKKINNKFEGDALITNQRKVALGVLTADCVPLLIYDHKFKMISAIHAGWRGAYKGVIIKVVKFLKTKGCLPVNLVAAIGPCISQQNYEVKNDFKSKFLKQSKNNRKFFKRYKNKTYFSLKKYIYSQLRDLGISKIDIIAKNTYNPKNYFFSARRSKFNKENDYGRNISITMIK